MIPLSKDEKLEYTDSESGLVFKFRPAIGSNEKVLLKASSQLSKIDLNNNDSLISMGDIIDPVIDAMLIGWTGVDKAEKPSESFKILDKVRLFNTICALNGLTAVEAKN
jgi:hypothetical protein